MKQVMVLKNNNKITSYTYSQRSQKSKISEFSIRFVFSGHEVYQLGRRQLSIYPDSFLLLNKGTHYNTIIESDMPVQCFSIDFDSRFLQDFHNCRQLDDRKLLDDHQGNILLGYNFNETIYPFKGDIKYNVSHLKKHIEANTQDELLINEYLHHCLINYYRLYDDEVFGKAGNLKFLNPSTRIEILRRLNLAKEYMMSNFNKNLSLEEIAQFSCLSVNHFLRTFKQAYQQSPHQFLIQVRLQRARMLLKNTPYPVNEVVSMVGFECASSFIRLFKSRYHLTPMQFKLTA